MFLKKNTDMPSQIVAVGLGNWYSELSDQNKVKLGRYLKDVDTSSKCSFVISLMDSILADENYRFAVIVGSLGKSISIKGIQKYDFNERLILAYYGSDMYNECLSACDEGLSMVSDFKDRIFERSDGKIPADMCCRNYKVNVLVGIMFDYDAGDKALDDYYEMGLISKEDLDYRKQSNKIFRLQKTFDGIYAVRVKD